MDATRLEMSQIKDYAVFEKGPKAIYAGTKKPDNAPAGYQYARVHLIYDVKHDRRHKARLVLDGHLTEIPVEAIYSSVVSLRSLRLITFLAAHNKLELWGANICNAYLESYIKEKLYIVAGPKFGPELEGHILTMKKAF